MKYLWFALLIPVAVVFAKASDSPKDKMKLKPMKEITADQIHKYFTGKPIPSGSSVGEEDLTDQPRYLTVEEIQKECGKPNHTAMALGKDPVNPPKGYTHRPSSEAWTWTKGSISIDVFFAQKGSTLLPVRLSWEKKLPPDPNSPVEKAIQAELKKVKSKPKKRNLYPMPFLPDDGRQ
jgi:hypothetical protein